jgi:D-tyrosyl-tRNA(Tyr) deacylase
MKAVIQRVTQASVKIEGLLKGKIGRGLLILLGVNRADEKEDADYLVDKIAQLRIFNDSQGKMNLSLEQLGLEAMVISQFTLLADCRKGRRPSFEEAKEPSGARQLYEYFIRALREKGLRVASGEFGTYMEVGLVNDGPVTIILDSKDR